jgi:hypothetical protein
VAIEKLHFLQNSVNWGQNNVQENEKSRSRASSATLIFANLARRSFSTAALGFDSRETP